MTAYVSPPPEYLFSCIMLSVKRLPWYFCTPPSPFLCLCIQFSLTLSSLNRRKMPSKTVHKRVLSPLLLQLHNQTLHFFFRKSPHCSLLYSRIFGWVFNQTAIWMLNYWTGFKKIHFCLSCDFNLFFCICFDSSPNSKCDGLSTW